MRRTFILLAILFQVAVLVFMAAEREYIVRAGETVYLRTAPVDPRDIFRGDYVRLDYDISTIHREQLRGDLIDHGTDNGYEVYAVLSRNADGLAEVVYATDDPPDEGLFIKGRIAPDWRFRKGRGIRVRYGIEAYFVQQGKGLEMEDRRGRRNEIQVPMEMAVALGGDGTAVIQGHRWSRLGIGMEVISRPEQNGNRTQETVENDTDETDGLQIRVTLMNASDTPLALVDLPDHRSFSLEPVAWAEKDWQLAHPPQPVAPEAGDVITLAPGETASFDFDFSMERWFVQAEDGKPLSLARLETREMFRLIYNPPEPEQTRHLPRSDLIWHGTLPSQAFNSRGRID